MATTDINLKRLQKALVDLRETKRRGESVRKFAKGANISASHVALMEGRKKKADLKKAEESGPSVFMLHRYLRYCGTTLTQFFAEFERSEPEDLTETQIALLATVRSLVTTGEDVQRRLQERVDDVRAWLGTQGVSSEQYESTKRPRAAPRSLQGREKDLKERGGLRRPSGKVKTGT